MEQSTTLLQMMQSLLSKPIKDLNEEGDEVSVDETMGSNGTGLSGIKKTGLENLDEIIGGLSPGLTVIAGRPLSVVDILFRRIYRNVAIYGPKNNVLSINSQQKYCLNTIAHLSRVSLEDLYTGQWGDREWDKIGGTLQFTCRSEQFVTYHTPSPTMDSITDQVEEYVSKHGHIDVIAIDDFHSLVSIENNSSRYERFTEVSKKLKALAVKYDTRVVVRVHLEKRVELPNMSHRSDYH